MLEALFSSSARIKLLKMLLLDPGGRFHLRGLAAETGLSVGNARRELLKLAAARIVTMERSGRQTYYGINEDCPIAPDLRAIFVKTAGVADVIRDALLPEAAGIRCAFIFGSFAEGAVTPQSDVDLLIIGEVTLRRAVSLLKKVEIGREINPTVVSEEEFASRITSGDHFFDALVDGRKIYLIGDDRELRRVAQTGQAGVPRDI